MVPARAVVNARTAPVFLIPVTAPAAVNVRTVPALMMTLNAWIVLIAKIVIARIITPVSLFHQSLRILQVVYVCKFHQTSIRFAMAAARGPIIINVAEVVLMFVVIACRIYHSVGPNMF